VSGTFLAGRPHELVEGTTYRVIAEDGYVVLVA
jgi:hypothetical protein